MAAVHLLSLGLRNFAFCGFENLCWSQARGEDFSKRIADAGFRTCFYSVPRLKIQRLWENEQIILVDWLKSLPKPIGLMACNDDRGHYVLEACQVAGLRVPDEVAVIGVDNDELICDLTTPPLSSIALNHEKAGYRAAQLLDNMMAGKDVDSKSIISLEASHVVARQSTDVLAIEDREVAEAVRFIHRHSSEAIQVSDVADSVVVSRRVLERRFREVLKKSVHDEIRSARVERASRMLVETDLSVSQIALHLGYPSDKHIARHFRKEKGITPLRYRKKFDRK
jgi:LacI family transcriptional regulator